MTNRRMPVPPSEPRLETLRFLGAPAATLLRMAVEHAILAPSSHNTQPWRFQIRDDVLELFADRMRALPGRSRPPRADHQLRRDPA